MSAPLPMEIDCRSVKAKLDAGEPFLFIDCREPGEHATVSIPEAKLVPMQQIASRLDELAEHKTSHVVVHCHHGGRSLRVASWLRQQGFEQAQSMAGGIDQWALEIQPGMPRY